MIHEQSKNDGILDRETLIGVKTSLLQGDISPETPILLIIKNIRSINPDVLNNLIHLLSEVRGNRGQPINFNLVLGIQSNSREDLHLRVHIQNSVKLTIKTFFFASMKNIIFETISNLLLDVNNILTFEPKVIK